jgi:hypothetical protein
VSPPSAPARCAADLPHHPVPAAKQAVTEFFDSLGFDAVDAGPLAENWRAQRDTPVYVTPYGAYGVLPGTPASLQVVREALAAAKPTAA